MWKGFEGVYKFWEKNICWGTRGIKEGGIFWRFVIKLKKISS